MTLTAENAKSAAELAPFTPLISDFYGYESLLSEHEKQYIVKLRAFLESEVRPIMNDLWTKAEFFPRHIVDGLAELGQFVVGEGREFEVVDLRMTQQLGEYRAQRVPAVQIVGAVGTDHQQVLGTEPGE